MNYIKLFEDFDRLDEITTGQKAALTRGEQLLNKGQAAVCYTLALEKVQSAHPSSSDALKKVQQKYGNVSNIMTEVFGNEWKDMDFGKWKTKLIKDIGMKPGTFNYVVNKMESALEGTFEYGGQELDKNMKDYFHEIEKMDRDHFVEHVGEYMDNPAAEKWQVELEPVK